MDLDEKTRIDLPRGLQTLSIRNGRPANAGKSIGEIKAIFLPVITCKQASVLHFSLFTLMHLIKLISVFFLTLGSNVSYLPQNPFS
jgi:hypothetical protein